VQAPWCGHCKALAPKYATAAEKLHEEGITNAIVASVDCTEQSTLCEQFEVQGYPTLIAFKKDTNNPIKYNNARETDAIISFIKKKSASPVTIVKAADELEVCTSSMVIILQLR
jgi:protein disulfide-isomerase A1